MSGRPSGRHRDSSRQAGSRTAPIRASCRRRRFPSRPRLLQFLLGILGLSCLLTTPPAADSVILYRAVNPATVAESPYVTGPASPHDEPSALLADGRSYYYLVERDGAWVDLFVDRNRTLDTVRISFDDGADGAPVSAVDSTLTVEPEGIPADGASTATVTIVPRDGNGEPLGMGLQLSIDAELLGPGYPTEPVRDHGDGTYTAWIRSDAAGSGLVAVTVEGIPLAAAPTVEYTPVAASPRYPRCADYEAPSISPTGNTYYVHNSDPDASDSNDGSAVDYVGGSTGPWATIRHAVATMRGGDVTYVAAGTYYETNVTFNRSGTESAPIVLSAHGSPGAFDEVILDGSADASHPVGIYLANDSSHIILQGLIIQNMKYGVLSETPASGHHRDIVLREVVVRNNGFPDLSFPGAGIYLTAVDGFKIDSVTAHANAGDGIQIIGGGADRYSQNGYIFNSVSYANDDGKSPAESDAHGIAINQGRNIAVCNSSAHGNRDHGFDVSDWPRGGLLSHDISFEGNVSYNNDNMGFAVNSDSHHVLFLRNLAHDNGTMGFMCYSGCGRLEYYHNVALRNTYTGFWVSEEYAVFADPGDNTLVYRNNISYLNNSVWPNDPALVVKGGNYQVVATHNDWHVPENPDAVAAEIGGVRYLAAEIASLGEGNVSEDPRFRDASGATRELRLAADSELIDAGTPVAIGGQVEPYRGAGPDIGREEE